MRAGSEIWYIDGGRMTHKGKQSVVEDAFADAKLAKSGTNTPAKSRNGTPAASAAATPAGSGGEGTGSPIPKKKKKKLTRNQYVLSQSHEDGLLTLRLQIEGAS
jgi:elongation factor 3